MKRIILTILSICFIAALASAQSVTLSFHDTPLAEALRRIDQSQTSKTVNFFYDELEKFRITKQITNLPALDAVRAVCEGLPVKVKAKGRNIFVEARKKAEAERQVSLFGKVEDGFLQVPLWAKITLHAQDSTFIDSAKIVPFYGQHNKLVTLNYHVNVPATPRDYLIKASLKNYDDAWQKVSVTAQSQKEVEVPLIKMHRQRTVNLRTAAITATKVKMFYKGDTLVYNADAFKLPEGSMLDDLIKQLDGVTMNDDGEIFVNGRKIDELLLGSRTFMRGNRKVLLKNLPYYTVKNIKVYDKRSERDMALGSNFDPKSYVMDVVLKPEYQRGYIANIEAAAGTEDRWLGRAFLLGFTNTSRYSVYLNANNVNERRHIGEQGHWSPSQMPQGLTTTRSVKAEMDYIPNKKWSNNIYAEYTSSSTDNEMEQRKEMFLDGRTPFSTFSSSRKDKSHGINIQERLSLKKPMWAVFDLGFHNDKVKGHDLSLFNQLDDTLRTFQRTVGLDEKRYTGGFAMAQGAVDIKIKKLKARFTFVGSAHYNEDKNLSAKRYETQASSGAGTVQHNAADYSLRKTSGSLMTSLTHSFSDRDGSPHIALRNNVSYDDRRIHDWLFHPDTLTLASRRDALAAMTDAQNSYESRQTNITNTLTLDFTTWYIWALMPGYTTGYTMWDVGIDLPLHIQRLDYQRGQLDTLARQQKLFVNPHISYHHPLTKTSEIEAKASLKTSPTEILDRISYRDTRSPLVVLEGNPALKPKMESNFSLKLKRRRQLTLTQQKTSGNPLEWNTGATFRYQHRDVAQSLSYNPVTGVSTYKPLNIRGAYLLGSSAGFSRAIDRKKFWTWQANLNTSLHHAIDHTMFDGQTESCANAVNTFTLQDDGFIQYSHGALNVRATANFSWRHSEGKMRDFQTLNALDFRYGLNGRYTLPRLRTTLSCDATMYSRRGYGSSALNTDDFVLNASVSQPFMKGKFIARLEAFDLLHQLSSTRYEVNAQGRTETWYRSLPHYVMAHLVYHWNKNPKKK